MHYFIDSNVSIGYIFSCDPWHKCSLNIFDADYLYCSKRVKNETKDVQVKKLDKYYLFLNILMSRIPNNSEYCNNSKFKSLVINVKCNLSYNEKLLFFEFFCEKFNFIDYIEFFDLKNKLQDFTNTYANVLISRSFAFFEKTNICENYSKTYNEIFQEIKRIQSLDPEYIHHPDDLILVDAHEFALKSEFLLFLVTGDKKFVEGVSLILNILALDDVKYLKDFC